MKGLDQVAIDIPPSLAGLAQERLRQMIIRGDLEFGEQVTETELSALFGLSKTPIREALMRLSLGDRLVEIKPRSGTYIISLKEKDISDISEMRITLEHAAIRAAMRVNRSALLAALEKNIAQSRSLASTVDLTAYRALDHAFHAIPFERADNPYLSESYAGIGTKVLAMRNRLTFSREYVGKSIGEHVAIHEALSVDDIDTACQIVADHIRAGFTDRTRRLLVGLASAH